MCLLVFAWKTHPDYVLVFAGNRDELHARASAAAGFWEDAPQVLGGRDLQAGGTWLGVTSSRRFAVVTNYREGPTPKKAPRSRGALAADFLDADTPADTYIYEVAKRAGDYRAFSLILGEPTALWYFSNRGELEPRKVPPWHTWTQQSSTGYTLAESHTQRGASGFVIEAPSVDR